MSTIELFAEFHKARLRYAWPGTLQAWWNAMRRHRRERRTLVALSRLDQRILRDMGFDPEEVYEALDGGWDEVNPASIRPYLPRTERV
ncbi:DUF1127 domain-containing protein [Chelativorans sp.]|uniref:DUF1127 domain-containing protein n=1 Tax=Chelativorans sp. TaxID=2203393 RepID=UPI0028112F62|nr:DUF1127 domain-containing protein [Chelativorans sp.]